MRTVITGGQRATLSHIWSPHNDFFEKCGSTWEIFLSHIWGLIFGKFFEKCGSTWENFEKSAAWEPPPAKWSKMWLRFFGKNSENVAQLWGKFRKSRWLRAPLGKNSENVAQLWGKILKKPLPESPSWKKQWKCGSKIFEPHWGCLFWRFFRKMWLNSKNFDFLYPTSKNRKNVARYTPPALFLIAILNFFDMWMSP